MLPSASKRWDWGFGISVIEWKLVYAVLLDILVLDTLLLEPLVVLFAPSRKSSQRVPYFYMRSSSPKLICRALLYLAL